MCVCVCVAHASKERAKVVLNHSLARVTGHYSLPRRSTDPPPYQCLRSAGCENPLILIDEVGPSATHCDMLRCDAARCVMCGVWCVMRDVWCVMRGVRCVMCDAR